MCSGGKTTLKWAIMSRRVANVHPAQLSRSDRTYSTCASDYGQCLFVDTVDNGFFGGSVGVADEIVVGFSFNLEFVEVDHFFDQCAAGTAGRHHGHIK